MPTVSQNIAYVSQKYVLPNRSRILHYVKVLLVTLCIAFFLECAIFNINFFRYLGCQEQSLDSQINLRKDADGYYLLSEADNVIEFKNLDTHISDIFIDLAEDQSPQLVTLKINFTDEAHETYFDTTNYTVGIPNADVSTDSRQSKFINLATTGNVNSLRIQVVDTEDTSYPVKLYGISINKPHEFHFVMWRFLLAFAILALSYAFRPRSSLYKIRITSMPLFSKGVIVVTTCIEIFLVSAYLFFGSNLVGVATENYNSGSWDQINFANTIEVGGDNAQQYAYLARSMANGHLYLDVEVPDWLTSMDNPYDKGARDELQKQTGVESLHDVAYKDGHYYVYFGVVPVILFYLPFYLITGSDFPSAIGVLLALWAFIAGCSALLDRFARYHFKRVSLGLYLLLQIPLVMCCGILYLAKFPTFYSLPIACALAFSVWGIFFWMRGRRAEHRCAWFFAGSLCMALVIGCRPQIALLSCIAFPLFWRDYITNKRIKTGRGAAEFVSLVAPYVLVLAGIMVYNYARFGSFFDLGANYNLTLNDMTKRGWSLGRILPALYAFFLQAPNMTGVFPYVQEVVFETTYMGQTIREATFGGVFACLPILWVLLFARPIIKMRVKERATHTVAGVIGVFVVSAVLLALMDAQMAGILQRYFSDFSFMLLLSAILLIFVANENIPTDSKMRGNLTLVLFCGVAMSVLYSWLLCFASEVGWYSDVYAWAYQDFLETVMFWT